MITILVEPSKYKFAIKKSMQILLNVWVKGSVVGCSGLCFVHFGEVEVNTPLNSRVSSAPQSRTWKSENGE